MEFSDNLLLPLRQQQSTIPGRSPIEEFYSDKSRIIYSSSFRRLQQKRRYSPLNQTQMYVRDLPIHLKLPISEEL